VVNSDRLAASNARTRRREVVLLLAICLPFLVLGLGLDFLDPGEGLYGTIPSEMLACGDWILPHFNGLPYLEKPPLYFWLAAATLALGVSAEWASRLWSALPALGSVLLTWQLGGRLYGPGAGLAAGIALSTSAGFALHVRRASPDLLTVFCITLALYGFVRDLDRPAGRGRFWIFYVGIALGLLAKGLIGAALPILIAGIWLARADRPRLGEFNLGWGAALVGLLALPWHLAVAWRNPAHFWFFLADNQVLRFLGRRAFLEDDVPISTLGFLVVTFLFCFPWGVFLLARRRPLARWGALVPVWAVTAVGIFALSGSKLEYYALPALPAVALLAGGAWAERRGIGWWLLLGAVGSSLVGAWAVWAGGSVAAPQVLHGLAELNVYYRILRDQGLPLPFASPRPFGLLLQGLGVTLLVGWAISAACWWRGHARGAFVALVLMAGGIAALIFQLLQVIEPHHSARAVGAAIVARAGTADLVVHEGSLEYSGALPLYAGRRILVVDGRRGDLEFASQLPEAQGMFLERAELARLWEGKQRVFLVTQRPRARSVVANLPPDSVHEVGVYGSRILYANGPAPPVTADAGKRPAAGRPRCLAPGRDGPEAGG
jgi:4-amino-4-deoxy-L-arabinose transferase-like glycosyltransferase